MNKYKKFSKKAQRRRLLRKGCLSKKAYDTVEEAYQKGQKVYFCKNCRKFHRSGKFSELIAIVKKKNAASRNIEKTA